MVFCQLFSGYYANFYFVDIRRLRFGERARFLRSLAGYFSYSEHHSRRQVRRRSQPAISASENERRSGHFAYDNQ